MSYVNDHVQVLPPFSASTGQWTFIWLLTNHMELLRSSQWHSMNWTTPWWENVYAFSCLWIHMASIWWFSARHVPQPSSVLACFNSFTPSVWSSAHKTHADLDWGQTDLEENIPIKTLLGCLVCALRIIVFLYCTALATYPYTFDHC